MAARADRLLNKLEDPIIYHTSYYQDRSLNRIYVIKLSDTPGASERSLELKIYNLAQEVLSQVPTTQFSCSVSLPDKVTSRHIVSSWLNNLVLENHKIKEHLSSDELDLKTAIELCDQGKALQEVLADQLASSAGRLLTEMRPLLAEQVTKSHPQAKVRQDIDKIRSRLQSSTKVSAQFFEDYNTLSTLLTQIGASDTVKLIPSAIVRQLLNILKEDFPTYQEQLFTNLGKIEFNDFLTPLKWCLSARNIDKAQYYLDKLSAQNPELFNLFQFSRSLLFVEQQKKEPSEWALLEKFSLEVLKKHESAQITPATIIDQHRRHIILTGDLFANEARNSFSELRDRLEWTVTDKLVTLELSPEKGLADISNMPSNEAKSVVARFIPSTVFSDSLSSDKISENKENGINWLCVLIERNQSDDYPLIQRSYNLDTLYDFWATLLSRSVQSKEDTLFLDRAYRFLISNDVMSNGTLPHFTEESTDCAEKVPDDDHSQFSPTQRLESIETHIKDSQILVRLYSYALVFLYDRQQSEGNTNAEEIDFCVSKIDKYKAGLSPLEKALNIARSVLQTKYTALQSEFEGYRSSFSNYKRETEQATREMQDAKENLSRQIDTIQRREEVVKDQQTQILGIQMMLVKDSEEWKRFNNELRPKLFLEFEERLYFWDLFHTEREYCLSIELGYQLHFVEMSKRDRNKLMEMEENLRSEFFNILRFPTKPSYILPKNFQSEKRKIIDTVNSEEYQSPWKKEATIQERMRALIVAIKENQRHQGKEEFLEYHPQQIEKITALRKNSNDKANYFWNLEKNQREEIWDFCWEHKQGIGKAIDAVKGVFVDVIWDIFWNLTEFQKEKLWEISSKKEREEKFWKADKSARNKLIELWKQEEKEMERQKAAAATPRKDKQPALTTQSHNSPEHRNRSGTFTSQGPTVEETE